MRRAICSDERHGPDCRLISSDNEEGSSCTCVGEALRYGWHDYELVEYRDDCPLVKVVLLDKEYPVRLAPEGWPNGKRHK